MSLMQRALAEWRWLTDPTRYKQKSHLIHNRITQHTHARLVAFMGYLGGVGAVLAGYAMSGAFSVVLMVLGLLIWSVPIMYVAKQWSEKK